MDTKNLYPRYTSTTNIVKLIAADNSLKIACTIAREMKKPVPNTAIWAVLERFLNH
ncbi:hypothetical protein RintRC_6685 [Richelia intracellularis]|nr:hypothetical protein RintRC_6685 [Richelia intracellularis]